MDEDYKQSVDLLDQISRAAVRAGGLTDRRTPQHCLRKRNAKLFEIAKYLGQLAENLDREATGVKLT